MNTESQKSIAQRYFETWNTGDITVLDQILAPNYVDHAHPEVIGVDGVKQSLTKIRQMIPDFNITIESMIAEDELVALRGIVRRTQQGQLTTSRVMWFVRILNGQMTDLWTGTETST